MPKTNTEKTNKPKFVNKTMQIVVSGKDNYGRTYDPASATAVISELAEAGTFTKLSVMANVANSILTDKEDAKGVRNVARIQSFDAENSTMEVTFFGKNVDFADKLTDLVIVPRVRTAHNSDKVDCIMYFEIVNPA